MRAILGGGIAGLSAAHYMLRKFPGEYITIYETSHRAGGWIKSRRLPNGVIFEQGPRTIRPRGEAGENTLQLISDLGLESQIIPITTSHPAAKTRMIYANGKLNVLPNSFLDIFTTLPPFQKPLIAYLLNDLTAKKKTNSDESIYNFVERRFGKDIAEYAISPMICGICAGDAKEISVKFLMENLFNKEQKYGGITKGLIYDLFKKKTKKDSIKNFLAERAKYEKWSIYSFRNGLEVLPYALEKNVVKQGVNLKLERTCTDIEFDDKEIILMINGEPKYAKHIISSLPAHNLADLLQLQHPILADHLRKIKSVTVGVVNLQYNLKLKIRDAFGFLVPPSENLPILGVIFDSCCFPNSENTVLTVMMGGHWFEKYFGKNPDEEDLLKTALKQVRNILKIDISPDNYRVNILNDCIPQYVVGHRAIVNQIETYIKANKLPLSLCGSSYYGVGVNDVILSAKNAVFDMIK